MKKIVSLMVVLSFLTACGIGKSRLNPFNWFGGDEEVIVATAEVLDSRPLVAQITTLKVDRVPGGAIIHAIGLPVQQGNYDAELVALNSEQPDKGVLSYEFRLVPPENQTRESTKRSREVVVGHYLSDQSLAGVRRIQVIAASNRRTVRR